MFGNSMSMTDLKKDISNYTTQTIRNRLVFCRGEIPGLTFFNVGKELSDVLSQEDLNSPLISYVADDAFSVMISKKYVDDEIGPYIALSNIGILFEKELGFNIRRLLETESISRTLIICSLGEIKNNHYYFNSEGDSVSIDLTGLPYLVLN